MNKLKDEISSWPKPKKGYQYKDTRVSVNVTPPILISGKGAGVAQIDRSKLQHCSATHTWWFLCKV